MFSYGGAAASANFSGASGGGGSGYNVRHQQQVQWIFGALAFHNIEWEKKREGSFLSLVLIVLFVIYALPALHW